MRESLSPCPVSTQGMCSTPRAEAAGMDVPPSPAVSQSNDSGTPNPTHVGGTARPPPVTADPEVKVDGKQLVGSVVVFLLERVWCCCSAWDHALAAWGDKGIIWGAQS